MYYYKFSLRMCKIDINLNLFYHIFLHMQMCIRDSLTPRTLLFCQVEEKHFSPNMSRSPHLSILLSSSYPVSPSILTTLFFIILSSFYTFPFLLSFSFIIISFLISCLIAFSLFLSLFYPFSFVFFYFFSLFFLLRGQKAVTSQSMCLVEYHNVNFLYDCPKSYIPMVC